MNKVAKLVMVDNEDKYLLLYRSDHPKFGTDPDLPGGTLEEGEQPLDTMLREVVEEIGVTVDAFSAQLLYAGSDYSEHKTHYSLFVAKLNERPEISISWEHSSYEWLSQSEFLNKAKSAKDTYMHMVYDVVKDKSISI